ncbi:hypothetical protein ES332_D07G113300v1 [Gossypium tomentosum]|uniref:Uncharacterized protein n=1 Tax=Gossypium tomentosum TaxID=34277 RepID=A0A5D2K5E7_GOSTO|nr:hypothetical protein ES332_D07G113300v1 [Gossypium tomentosum]
MYDWTILKYPQLTGSSRQRLCSGKAALNSGVSTKEQISYQKQSTLKSIWLTLAFFPISRFSRKLKLLIY